MTRSGTTSGPSLRAARLAVLVAVLAVVALIAADVAAASSQLKLPKTIKVARRWPANSPSGVIYRVDTVDFRTYCVRVLSHEWAPATSFSPQSLRAGALAVKSYGWYWASHPTKLSDVARWGADVDDSVNYQVYMNSDYGQKYWDAVDAVAGLVLTKRGAVHQASYRAGTYGPGQNNGYIMQQWGTEYWADHGKTYDWITHYFYRGVEITPVSGGDSAAAYSGNLSGSAKLVTVAGVELSAGPHTLDSTLEAEFTLRNVGGEKGSWNGVTLVLRGPGDENRDMLTTETFTLEPGQARTFTARCPLDLGGEWRGWLVAPDGEKLSLIGDGDPFSFEVASAAHIAADPRSNIGLRLLRDAPARRGVASADSGGLVAD